MKRDIRALVAGAVSALVSLLLAACVTTADFTCSMTPEGKWACSADAGGVGVPPDDKQAGL